MKTIEIVISTDGSVKLQTKGFAGTGCKDASKAIEQALGVVTSDQKTPEAYQTDTSKQNHTA